MCKSSFTYDLIKRIQENNFSIADVFHDVKTTESSSIDITFLSLDKSTKDGLNTTIPEQDLLALRGILS